MKVFKCSNDTLINVEKVVFCYIQRIEDNYDLIFILDVPNMSPLILRFNDEKEAVKEKHNFERFCINNFRKNNGYDGI